MPARNDTLLLGVTAATVVLADQITKYAIVAAIGPLAVTSRIDLAGHWLALEYVENRGVAFGLMTGAGGLLAVAALAVLAFLLVHFARTPAPPRWETVAIGAIAGGAIGNLIDRFRFGYVIDFVAVGSWPNFNVADSAITVGVILLLWGWMRGGAPGHAVDPA